MRRNLLAFVVMLIFTLGLCVPAGAAADMTKEEAKKQVEKLYGYPKKVWTSFEGISSSYLPKAYEGIQTLIKDKYIQKRDDAFSSNTYAPTQKGRPFVRSVTTYPDQVKGKENWRITLVVTQEVVKSVDAIDTASNPGIAVVKVTLGLEPVQPFFDLFCESNFECKKQSKFTRQEQFKLKRGPGGEWIPLQQ